jgi:histone deacetylase HOS3
MTQAAARGMPVTNGHSRRPSRRLSNVSMAVTEVPPAPAVSPFPPSFSADYDDIRPESSLSVRTATVRPPAKKGKPAGGRRDSANQFPGQAPKKSTKTPGPKSQTVNKAKNQEPAAAGQGSNRTSMESSPARNSNGKDADTPSTASDVESNLGKITNGMKKIKINVVTKEMKAARARAQKEKDAPRSAENGDTPSTSCNEKEASQLRQKAPTSKSRKSTENLPQTPVGQRKKNSGIFIAYQPEGPTPEAVETSGKTTWMPVNQITSPSPIKGHGFTATSTIPFSATPVKQVTQAPAIVPETPAAAADINEGREIPETPEHRL